MLKVPFHAILSTGLSYPGNKWLRWTGPWPPSLVFIQTVSFPFAQLVSLVSDPASPGILGPHCSVVPFGQASPDGLSLLSLLLGAWIPVFPQAP